VSSIASFFILFSMFGDQEAANALLPRENQNNQRAVGTQNEEHNDQELANGV
jgi:hypothetical protein